MLARRRTRVLTEHADRIEVVSGDVRDARAVDRAMRGAHTVYHLAGYAKAWARRADTFHETNTGGTRHVCTAAREHGVQRVVHMSTALLAPAEDGQPVDLRRTVYQRSKADAEAVIQAFVAGGGSAVTVRPSRTFGPGPLSQSNSVTKLIDLHSRRRFFIRLADGDVRANYVHVRDVIAGLIAAAERGTDGWAYVLGGENCSIPEFLGHIEHAAGPGRRVRTLAPAGARVVALASEALAHIGLEPLVTRDWLDILFTDWPVSSEPAIAQLGYRPRPVRDAVARTVAWLATTERHPFRNA